MEELLARYSDNQKKVIFEFFEKLAKSTNKTGKMLESKKEKIAASWEKYETHVVIDSLLVYINMDVPQGKNGRGTKGESYVLGIMKNKAAEAQAKRGGYGERKRQTEADGRPDEGERLKRLVTNRRADAKEPECDF